MTAPLQTGPPGTYTHAKKTTANKTDTPCLGAGRAIHQRGRLIVRPGTVVARLSSVQVVALRIPGFLLARQTGAETTGGIRAAGGAVALATGPVLLVLAPVGLGLLWTRSVSILL